MEYYNRIPMKRQRLVVQTCLYNKKQFDIYTWFLKLGLDKLKTQFKKSRAN